MTAPLAQSSSEEDEPGEPGEPVVTVLDDQGGEHLFTKETLVALGPQFIINVDLASASDSACASTGAIPTVLSANVLKELTKFDETREAPNPYLAKNRVDKIPPGDLLDFLGIDDKPVDEGPDHDFADDYDDSDREEMQHKRLRERGSEYQRSRHVCTSGENREDEEYDEYDEYDEYIHDPSDTPWDRYYHYVFSDDDHHLPETPWDRDYFGDASRRP
jgi:hypothetical protein